MINIKYLNTDKIKIDKKSYKNVCNIGYMVIKDLIYTTFNRASPLHLIIDKVNEYIEESNGNKYLMLVATCEGKVQ